MSNFDPANPPPIVNDKEEINLLNLFLALWAGRWWIVLITVLFTAGAITFAFLSTPTYRVVSIWLPKQNTAMSGQMGQIAGLAGLMGVSFGGAGGNIEQFYPQIITSPAILQQIIGRKWPTLKGDSTTIGQLTLLDSNTLVPQLPNISKTRLQRSMLQDYLLTAITFEGSPTMNVLTVVTPDPLVSSAINEFILEQLKNFVEENRVRTTTEERDFFYSKYMEFKDSLNRAESRLLYYQLANRQIGTPVQQLEMDRLQREIGTVSSLANEFRKQYEMAQINISKKVSDFQMLQHPEPPTAKFKPKRKIIAAAGVLVGGLVGCCFVIVLFWWRRNRQAIRTTLKP